jgi:transcriptional regulator with XRE-family HTH domain
MREDKGGMKSDSLTELLQRARKARRLSQLELSLRIGVSQRHVSFVESGRARPSRELLLTWLQELQAPFSLQNTTLIEAGFAPEYGDVNLDDASMTVARDALLHLLQSHDPLPSFVLDAEWNGLHLNRGAMWLAQQIMPAFVARQNLGKPVNMLDAFLAPDGMATTLANFDEVARQMLGHLREEVHATPTLAPRVQALADLLQQRGTASRATNATHTRMRSPTMTSRFITASGQLAFFSMFTTFGTPHDITLASLRVEHMFPADEATRARVTREVGVVQ